MKGKYLEEFRDLLKKEVEKERIKFIQRKMKAKVLGKSFDEEFEFYDLEGENCYEDLDEEKIDFLNEKSDEREIIKKINKKKKKGIEKYFDISASDSNSQTVVEENLDENFSDFIDKSQNSESENSSQNIYENENSSENENIFGKEAALKEAEKIKILSKKISKKRKERKRTQKIELSSSKEGTEEDTEEELDLKVLKQEESSLSSESDSVY